MRINQEDLESQQNRPLDRLDALPFSKWHFFVAIALGFIWFFDGYEVTMISLFRVDIQNQWSKAIFKGAVTCYQVGCIVGSCIFGVAAFSVGRKNIFIITLAIYFFGVLCSAFGYWSWMFLVGRFLTGLSVGGQFTAIFTAVDQFMPPTHRGRINITIDGTWHLGGSLSSILILLTNFQDSWKLLFLVGLLGILPLGVMRRNVPQSPRWLLSKQRARQANDIISCIEQAVQGGYFTLKAVVPFQSGQFLADQKVQIQDQHICQQLKQIVLLIKMVLQKHTKKFIISFSLIFTQAFFFNMVYYQYPLILSSQYNLTQKQISLYMLPLSVVSFLSTIAIGPLFDLIGRRKMLLITYGCSAIMLIVSFNVTSSLLVRQLLVVLLFVFASPAASAANLIASQVFPTSCRTILLFVMFCVSMLGGVGGVWLDYYWLGSVMMAAVGLLAFLICPDGENKTLQEIQKL